MAGWEFQAAQKTKRRWRQRLTEFILAYGPKFPRCQLRKLGVLLLGWPKSLLGKTLHEFLANRVPHCWLPPGVGTKVCSWISRLKAKRMLKLPYNWCSSHTLAKRHSKFSKPGFNNTWTVNFQVFKLVLEKAEEPEIKLPTSAGSWKKQESSRKTSIAALLTLPKPLTVWITTNCEKFFKRWEY